MTGKPSWQAGPMVFMQRSLSPQETIQQLEIALKTHEAQVERLNRSSLNLAIVLNVGEGKTLIAMNGAVIEVETPREEALAKLKPTDWVRVRPENNQIVSIAEGLPKMGGVHEVKTVLDERHVEIDMPAGITRVVLYHAKEGEPAPKPGDQVQLDVTGVIVVRNLGSKKVDGFAAETGVEWEDIGGLVEAKKALVEAIEEPITKKALYARYGKKPVKGVLLFGPSGTGKTMLCKAAATAIAKLHGASAKASGFIYVKGPEMLNKYVGASEGNVRTLFTSARAHALEHGYPAVIVIDEADAILGKRGQNRGIEGMERTIVPQFLAEMDGLDESGAMILLLTNRPDALDPAIVRDGRIDRKIHVPRPTQDEAAEVFSRHLRGKPLDPSDIPAFAKAGAAALFDKAHVLYEIHRKDAPLVPFTLGHLASGAMCAGIVENATQLAIRREIEDGKEGAITTSDIAAAVKAVLEENRRIDHTDDLSTVLEPLKPNVVDVRRVGGAAGKASPSGLIQVVEFRPKGVH